MEAEPRTSPSGEIADGTSTSATDPARGDAAATPSTVAPHDRCVHHPGRSAVARCAACAEPVCLSCAVPVRGRILGPECLAAELGDPAFTSPPEPDRHVGVARWALAGAVLALVATIGPWTRTGAGDRVFGAWVPSLRWSMIAGPAAVVLLAAAGWLRSRGSRATEAIVIGAGSLVTAASALAIAYPPTFQAASWAPWLAAAGGAVAALAAFAAMTIERRPTQGV